MGTMLEVSQGVELGSSIMTLWVKTFEADPNFLIYLFLLVLTEAYNLGAKVFIKPLSIRISKCSCSVRVYQSYPPMIRKALFWTTCSRFIFCLEMKVHSGEAWVVKGRIYAL